MPEQEPLKTGEQVGEYRVEAVLGQGGMGFVYRASGPDDVEVALKVVKPDLGRDETFRRRFDREARIAQTVVHDHVVQVLATGEHQGLPYMAQRLVGNGNLAERLEREPQLDVETTVRLCRQVAGGLDAMHDQGLIHRDVKPANILLDEEGDAYITDFGLAKDTQGTLLTMPGQALGSADYMSPEQVRGEDVTPATDVYGLGCVAFECLCGSAPFADRAGMRVLWAHLQDPPVNPTERRPGLPAGIGEAVLKALEKDAEKRPQSASVFARLLQMAAT